VVEKIKLLIYLLLNTIFRVVKNYAMLYHLDLLREGRINKRSNWTIFINFCWPDFLLYIHIFWGSIQHDTSIKLSPKFNGKNFSEIGDCIFRFWNCGLKLWITKKQRGQKCIKSYSLQTEKDRLVKNGSQKMHIYILSALELVAWLVVTAVYMGCIVPTLIVGRLFALNWGPCVLAFPWIAFSCFL